MSTQANPTEAAAQPAPASKPSRLRRNVLMLLVPCLLIGGGLYVWITGGRFEETENANMRLARITIASEIAGRVVSVNVRENVAVHKGDVLFEVDPEPLQIALNQANAAVESARLNVIELKAAYSQALTQEKIAADDAAFYQDTLDRQKALTAKGVATNSSLDDAVTRPRRPRRGSLPQSRRLRRHKLHSPTAWMAQSTITRWWWPPRPRGTRPPTIYPSPRCARRPTAWSTRPRPSGRANMSPPAHRCSPLSRQQIPGSTPTSRNRNWHT
jgi:hypothetical protein